MKRVSGCSAAIALKAGAITLHGPHHVWTMGQVVRGEGGQEAQEGEGGQEGQEGQGSRARRVRSPGVRSHVDARSTCTTSAERGGKGPGIGVRSKGVRGVTSHADRAPHALRIYGV